MRQDAGSRWSDFEARQTISTRRCDFDWVARSGPAGVVRVRDALTQAGGRLRVDLFGVIPIASPAPDPELTRGELIRYLAEIPWAPGAILSNPDLDWTAEADGRITVAAAADATAKVSFTLDQEGLIAEAFCADRPRAVEGGFRRAPWRGRFSDYVLRDAVWIPERGAVGWVSDGADVEVWQARIRDWRLHP